MQTSYSVNTLVKHKTLRERLFYFVRGVREDIVTQKLEHSEFDFMHVRKEFEGTDHLLAVTQTLGPGESELLELGPLKAGYYTYLCLVPGHANVLGMRGIMHVQPAPK